MRALFPLLVAGHLIGDFVLQTDWQARTKAWSDSRPRSPGLSSIERDRFRRWLTSLRANQAHCLTYHLAVAAFVLPVWRTWGTALAFAVSWVSHGFIDRRWPVRWLLRHTGSAEFSEQLWGVIATDQALHLAILAVIAAVAA